MTDGDRYHSNYHTTAGMALLYEQYPCPFSGPCWKRLLIALTRQFIAGELDLKPGQSIYTMAHDPDSWT